MSRLIKAIQTNNAVTHNGAVTHSTSDSKLVDLFFLAGASRNMSPEDILSAWHHSYAESELMSLQLLLWARDCRGGAGERKFFRVVYGYLKMNHPDVADKITAVVPFFGRWDDLWKSGGLNDVEKKFIAAGLNAKDGLLAKWIPRRTNIFNELAQHMGLSLSGFRKLIVKLSNTVEQKMSAHEFGAIDYKSVPSVAMSRYSKSFSKHDQARFGEYMEKVKSGDTTINAGTLYPYDLIRAVGGGGNINTINEQWKALPDYYTDENILVMADVSGSMYSSYSGSIRPIDISVSLAMYTAERNRGLFQDAFITFTSEPTLQVLKGPFSDRLQQIQGPVGFNTDLQKAFELVLNKAVGAHIPQEEMPSKILIVSDMEFDNTCVQGTSVSSMKAIRSKYENAGYRMPNVVFWNVNGRLGNSPVKVDERGVAMVSGASPAILKSVLGDDLSPYGTVLKTVDVPRYQIF